MDIANIDIRNNVFHFDLRHIGDNKTFVLNTGDKEYILKSHTAQTLEIHKKSNIALGLLVPKELRKITHYVEGVETSTKRVQFFRVTYKSDDDKKDLPNLAMVAIYIPASIYQKHRKVKFSEPISNHYHKLSKYGITSIEDNKDIVQILNDSDKILTPIDIAKAIVFQHPQLASMNADTATIIMDDYINNPKINDLAVAISSQRVDGWYSIEKSVDKEGNVLTWGKGFKTKTEGAPVYHYKLTQKTMDAAGPAISDAVKNSKNDERLKNKKWSVNQGLTNIHCHSTTIEKLNTLKSEDDGISFTLKNQTPGHGLEVYESSIRYKEADNPTDKASFSIKVKNTYLRTLCAYVEFFDEADKSLGKPKYLAIVTAVNVILGIPMPTDPTKISFEWPEEATSCKLYFGGLGSGKYDMELDAKGMVLTGIFQYGIPSLLLLAQAAIEDSSWYKSFISDEKNVASAFAIGLPIVGGGVTTAAGLLDTKMVLFTFADAIAGILAQSALSALRSFIEKKIAEAEAEKCLPFVGWAFAAANAAIDYAELTETTIEVLSSPATYETEILRKTVLNVSVKPDPTHGTATQPAVWPEVADHYKVMVQYKDGTNFSITGEMDSTTSSEPIKVTFNSLPAGGIIKVICSIYSKNDWLAGIWTSSSMYALPPKGKNALDAEGCIQENLVPLTPKTQYLYKEKLAYNGKEHIWKSGEQPKELITALDSNDRGNNLSELIDITINNEAYMAGYCWKASGLDLPVCNGNQPCENGQVYTFQNICVLGQPENAMKYPTHGFSIKPHIIYDQFGPMSLFNLPLKFENNLDNAEITEALNNAFKEQGYPISTSYKVVVKTKTAEWYIGKTVDDLTFKLKRVTDIIQVFDYSTPDISPNNFYLDTCSDGNHIRQIVLDDTTPFNLSEKLSWGRLNNSNFDKMTVHPSGYAIGVNTMNNIMEILKISEEGVPNDKAPIALILSGQGTRQGLIDGPKSVTVTADGRILVLEENNKRVQAFDTNGNPVPCFDGEIIMKLSSKESIKGLNNFMLTEELRQQFKSNCIVLSSEVEVRAKKINETWIIADKVNSQSYKVQLNKEDNDYDVMHYLPYFNLQSQGNQTIYLDIATELKGYLYILSYSDEGEIQSDYHLDIYEPNGKWLVCTPDTSIEPAALGVNVGKITVDMWRNLFTLNYEHFLGPNNRTEPSVSLWIPTTPGGEA